MMQFARYGSLAFLIAVSTFASPAIGAEPLQTLQNGEDGVTGLDGARSVAVSADGAQVFVASEIDDALVVFARDAATGMLTPFEVHQEGVGGVSGLDGAASVAVAPDGENVYVASAASEAVAVFSRDLVTGTLSFVEAETEHLASGGSGDPNLPEQSPRFVEVTPDGQQVLVLSASLVVFDRDAQDGSLAFHSTTMSFGQGRDFTQSPDGLHAYGSTPVPIQAGGGDMVFRATHDEDGSYASEPLFLSGRLMRSSPDGRFLYGLDSLANQVCWWERDAGSGDLTSTACRPDTLPSLARDLALSPDGASLYAGTLTTLLRYPLDVTTGTLAAPEEVGATGVVDLAVSPDDRQVLVVSRDSGVSQLRIFAPEPGEAPMLATAAMALAALAHRRARDFARCASTLPR